MSGFDAQPLWLSLKLAGISTLLLLVISIPLCRGLSSAPPALRAPLQALLNLPLVLPPTVLGFYLLLAFSPEHFPGRFLEQSLGLDLAFSFPGLVVGSVLFSLPFMINPLLAGFDALPPSLTEAARVLGKSRGQILARVLLPNLKPSLLAGAALSFAHTLGEFGVVLMIGGKIPGKTKVASVAVYDEVEALRFAHASLYSLILAASSFLLLVLLFGFGRKSRSPF
jgi:molybdate transport system permease protein